MNTIISEVLQFVKENDVKFIRLSFCDIFGVHKNIAIMAGELESAFKNGVSFNAYAINNFSGSTRSDLLLFPDPATLTVLPWRPGPGRVVRFYCDIKKPDGSAFALDSRSLLKETIQRVEKKGYVCKIGAECEFYLFKTDENGEPTKKTFDKGGYSDISPLDKGENIRREICLTLEEMGIKPQTSRHEQGPGQNEIDFKFSTALTCADNFQSFKSVVKAIAARNGLFASFMPMPLAKAPGSAMHINISLSKNGLNVFKNANEGHSNIAESFIAGVLEKTAEITAFLNPLANSYERFGTFEAPKYVSWSHQNHSQLISIPAAISEKVRMELRSPDPSANPYLAFALIVAAGMDGVERNIKLPPPVDADLYTADTSITSALACLPDSLQKALSLAKNSEFVKGVMGEELLSKYISLKEAEAAAFEAADDKALFYEEQYFNNI
ncbi:glutamine synthetase [Elusimicrobium posterum]|uniref:glutamine synthetase family protein n=1 Tax=Elusimicrobium posterum TaxID=3116653 RepID=UPI003C751780